MYNWLAVDYELVKYEEVIWLLNRETRRDRGLSEPSCRKNGSTYPLSLFILIPFWPVYSEIVASSCT